MLIDAASRPEELAETGLRWHSGSRFVAGWKGHLYVPGKAAGHESVDHLMSRLDAGEGLNALMGELCGVFGLFVHDRAKGGWQIAIDNAGLYKVFWDEHGCATSLLELVRVRGTRADQLLPAALIEFLAHGAVYGPGTFVAGVSKLRWDELLELAPAGGTPRLLSKRLEPPNLDDGESVVVSFGALARSLAGLNFSADITGGVDTRVITCLLHHAGAVFETAISGPTDAEDVRIAAEIAQLLKRPFFVTPHDLKRLDDELPSIFRNSDGQMDCCEFHRPRQHCLARLARGVQVISHGGGGSHFKDFFALQDFPRYGSRVVNFERYYDLRIAPVVVPSRYLSERGAVLLDQVRPRTLARFSEYKAATNNESYDRVAYFVRGTEKYGRFYTNYVNMGLDVVAPLLDWRNAQIGMKLPPWRKFRNRWHREVITAHCPRLAALRTSEGFSASTELHYLLPDIVGYVGMQGRQVARKTSERLLGKALFTKLGSVTVDDPGLIPTVQGSSVFFLALERVKAAGLFAPALKPADIRASHVGRVLTLGMFLEYVDQRGRPVRTAGTIHH